MRARCLISKKQINERETLNRLPPLNNRPPPPRQNPNLTPSFCSPPSDHHASSPPATAVYITTSPPPPEAPVHLPPPPFQLLPHHPQTLPSPFTPLDNHIASAYNRYGRCFELGYQGQEGSTCHCCRGAGSKVEEAAATGERDSFVPGTIEHARMETLVSLGTMQHRGYDRDVLQQLGRVDEFNAMMTPQWTSLLRCSWLQYDELTVEFLSTFQYDTRSLTYPRVVSFALGRQTHTMSVAHFAVAFGLYSQEQVAAPDFEGLLRGSARAPTPGYVTEEELSAFWRTISTQPNTDLRLASQIRDPFLRYIHRILGSTLIPRSSGKDKVSSFDLFCLYCIQGCHPANLATILLTSFARPRRGGRTTRLDMGPYIGHLAHHLRVFLTYPVEHVTRGPETTPYELYDMQTSGMVTFDALPRWMPMLSAPEHAPAVPPPSTHHEIERDCESAQKKGGIEAALLKRYRDRKTMAKHHFMKNGGYDDEERVRANPP
ncbi:hypothetical protein R6Q59_016535 [Mikania micrantha]